MATVAQKRRARAARKESARRRIELEWQRRFKAAQERDGSSKSALGGAYRDAQESRGYAGWWPGLNSADVDTLPDREHLLERARDVDRNVPYARSIAHTMKREVVGRGIWPRPARAARALGWNTKRTRKFSKDVLQIWNRWAPKAGVQGFSIYQIQKLVQLALVRDGECFVQFVGLDPMPHRPYRLALSIIEAHRVSTPTDRKISQSRIIRDGIELTRQGMPIALWVEVEDLAELNYFSQRLSRPGRSRWRRIPLYDDASGLPNIVHIRDAERISARSLPMLAGAIDQVHVLGEFVEAELHAKKAEGCIAGIITSEAMDSVDSDSGSGASSTLDLEPGLMARLMPGESISFLDPKRPGGSFGPFVEFMLRSVAFSAGIPYEVAYIAFAGMNYSNARTTLLHAQRYFEDAQDTLIEGFLRATYERLLWEAWQQGDLKLARWPQISQELATDTAFQGQGWKWVDPLKEAQAAEVLLRNKLTSRTKALAPHGVDFDDIVADLDYEDELMRESGMETAPAAQAPGAPDQKEDGGDEEE